MNRPVVVFTVTERPHYLRQALGSWSRVRGIAAAALIFRVEPGCPQALALCEQARFGGETIVTENLERFGELSNPWHAISDGFTRGDYVICAEDDDLVSTDALEYFTWAGDRFRDRPEVLAVNAFRQHPAGGAGEVALTTGFTSWVWATWAGRWDLLRGDWDHDYTHRGWDWRIIDHWIGELGYRVAQPGRSKSQHIGTIGAHFRPGDQERLQSRCFTAAVGPQQYREAVCVSS